MTIIFAFAAESLTDQMRSPGWELALGFCSHLLNLEVDSLLSLVKCALALHCGSSPFYEELMELSALILFIILPVTISVPCEVCFFLHSLFFFFFFFFFLQHILLPIEQKILHVPFSDCCLSAPKSHVHHIYVFVTKFIDCCKLILLYTAKHTYSLLHQLYPATLH